jgi:predicted peptidase
MMTWMRQKIRFVFVALVLFFINVSVNPAQEKPIMLFKIKELKSGLKLRYTLSLPRDYSPNKFYPLVVALHYGGKVTPFYSKDFVTTFVGPAMENLEAIIVAPDCPAEGWTNPVSESAVLELMLLLMEEYHIDSDRTVLLGYSIGGSGTWYLAARHPDLFSAAVPISAPAEVETIPIIQHVPVYVIHGGLDELFPAKEIKRLYEKQKLGGAEIELKIVMGASHYQLARFINPLKATIPWIQKIWDHQ